MRTVVMRLLPRRYTLITSAAVISSLRVLRMRAAGRTDRRRARPARAASRPPRLETERPRASFGKRRSESPIIFGVV
jgi:hypothetical protein